MSARVCGGFWTDSRIVTQPTELNDPDLKEGFQTGKMFKTFRKISLNCTAKRASNKVSSCRSIYLKLAYIWKCISKTKKLRSCLRNHEKGHTIFFVT